MKPDIIVCQNCGKEIDKGKWCSDKCRMAFRRRTEQPEQISPNKPEHVGEHEQTNNPNMRDVMLDEYGINYGELTKTDKTYLDAALEKWGRPYYYFIDRYTGEYTPKEGTCVVCKKKFKSGLVLNRYCSYQHHVKDLGGMIK